MRLIDISGQRFGKLIVIKRAKSTSKDAKFLCKCDCGNEVIKNGRTLRDGRALLDCGCQPPKLLMDLTGKRFGKLVALKRINRHSWQCQCDCGRVGNISAHKLRKGIQKSCGCLFYFHDDREGAMIQQVYNYYSKDAKKRNLYFNLNKKQFGRLILASCYYCGIEWSNQQRDTKKKDSNFILKYNGIDRVNSQLGYEISNIVSCCRTCNHSKRLLDLYTFKTWIIKVYKYFAEQIPDFELNKKYQYSQLLNSFKGKVEITTIKSLYAIYRYKAENRRNKSIPFKISLSLFRYLILQPCFYCNKKWYSQSIYRGFVLTYNGIDRVDNSRGYTWDNTITCCGTCNNAKEQMTIETFRRWIKRVYYFWANKKMGLYKWL